MRASLPQLLSVLDAPRVVGHAEGEVTSLAYDSRSVVPGGLFAAIPGAITDGHRFLPEALAAGARVLLVEHLPGTIPTDVTCVVVPDARRALARVAAAFHGEPSRHMRVVGITGTNGKTTVSYLVEAMLQRAGLGVGVVGTTGVRISGRERPAAHTTPEGPDLQRLLAEMQGAGAGAAVIEVSSHALQQGRAVGCHLDVAAYTNLSRDHLDFHGDMERYASAKSRIVTELLADSEKPTRRLVANVDDPRATACAALWTDVVRVSAATGESAEVWPVDVTQDLDGIRGVLKTPSGDIPLRSPLVGDFNRSNLTVAAGIGLALDLPVDAIEAGVRTVRRIPGRMEPVVVTAQEGGAPDAPRVLVDYAHTPDALERVLKALRPLVKGEIVTVFGCGGDRDRGKRPLMGKVASQGSDRVVVTSDNPRMEEPQAIIDEILPGLGGLSRSCTVQPDRRAAIGEAIVAAGPDDLVLIAGKGHERIQIVGDSELRFSDQDVARDVLLGVA